MGPCLDKGDMLFVVATTNLAYYQNFTLEAPTGSQAMFSPTYEADSGDLYTIEKIYKADPTDTTYTDLGHEDRFRIVLDKNIPFAGTSTNQKGYYAYTNTDNQFRAPRQHQGRCGRPLQILPGHYGQLRVRLRVLQPRQLRGRRVRVLQGLHEGRLCDPVGLRRLSGTQHSTTRASASAAIRLWGLSVSDNGRS